MSEHIKLLPSLQKYVESVISVLGVSEVKSQGIRKGQVVDIEEAVHAINSSLESAERMAGYSASHVIVSLGGSQISCQNSTRSCCCCYAKRRNNRKRSPACD